MDESIFPSARWQKRVIAERDELKIKLDALTAFIRGPGFAALDHENIYLLCEQQIVMIEYLDILDTRIQLFTQPREG